ncbi:MAG TPA: TlpA disulfide reductase family protein [Candidatus Angelobacter sp.]|nr:TlpA disulfide reductase family protein [Candidatus Angelobacter sp.]
MKKSLLKVEFVVTSALLAVVLLGGNAANQRRSGVQSLPPDGLTIGSSAPDFELKILGSKGKTMKLSDLKGKAVLVDFWATYCEPCKIEMPWFAELQQKYGPQGFQVIGVAMDDEDTTATISAFAKKLGVNYPILLGTEHVADLYGGIDGLPMSFFIDRSGKIVDRQLGLVDKSILEDNIKKSLAPVNPVSEK